MEEVSEIEPGLADATGAGGLSEARQLDTPRQRLTRAEVLSVVGFVAILVMGTFLVKWHPYYLKGFKVASHHSMGASILSGRVAASPKGWHAALSYADAYGKAIWQALVVGLLVASAVQELLPRHLLLRLFGSGRHRSTLLAGMVAVPSMMCTCCSAPPTVSLARSRASVGATMAYWLGNPVLNPATIVFMGFVLGWRWSVLRIVVGLVLVFGVATLAQRFFGYDDIPEAARATLASAETEPSDDRNLAVRYFTTLGRLCVVLIPEYIVIVLALGGARAFLFPTITSGVGHALWLVLVLAVAGTMFVIPTAGEVPIVATFLGFGLGAAGGGALMMTLPAVSLPSLIMVGRAVPSRILAFVAGAVVVAGLVTAGLAAAWGL